jgi:hypothetical protein
MPQAGPVDQWTPKLVRERLIEAATWVRYYGGPVGPAPMRSALPGYAVSLEDHLAEGWGIPEVAGNDDEAGRLQHMPLPPGPDRITALEDALTWVGRYVARDHRVLARILQMWIRCRVYRGSFDAVCADLRISRAHAYVLRDRALGLIARGLDGEGHRP